MAQINDKIKNKVPPEAINEENIDTYAACVEQAINNIEEQINEDKEKVNDLFFRQKELIKTHHFMGYNYPQTDKVGSVFFIVENKNNNNETEGEN